MSKKVVDGIEISDDMPVTEYDGKFAGVFELDVNKAAALAYDDTVYFVVTTRLDSYSFKPTKFGDLKRVNTFKVDGVRVMKQHELDTLHRAKADGTQDAVDQLEFIEIEDRPADKIYVDDNGQLHDVDDANDRWSAPDIPTGGRDYQDPILKAFLEV